VFLTIKSGFLFMWSAQPSILIAVTIMIILRQILALPWPGIEPQSPSPQQLATKTAREGNNALHSADDIFLGKGGENIENIE